eukprot:CAMPEP_0202962104 /NCGR_PEP_ID=MMETSP1396-20130829/6204_1 /ASSEMBLY_ACC=CAM_ASM_000872 /TAXON_ID= /ORGANISM="Pseudokeronopsis sp., Strain Brazil" /LENGTH=55 /DNA_ID=CAMNT_0049682457 /DNA_START=302 /DNA_END=469 /DNA_ORIENTATION=-
MMRYTVVYRMFNDQAKKNRFDIVARVRYSMFPELYGEFDPRTFPTEFEKQLEEVD